MRPGVYVAIDLEAYPNNSTWQSFAAVAIKVPEYVVVMECEIYCDRSTVDAVNDDNQDFWARHPQAFEHNMQRGVGINPEDAERDIVAFVKRLKRRFPHFYLVLDCPAFDVRLVDNILEKHGESTLSHRGNGVYHQAICTWTMTLTIAQMLRMPARELKDIMRRNETDTGVIHTPLADANRILQRYFNLNNFIKQHC